MSAATRNLHARPSAIGRFAAAAAAGPRRLVLSHLMARSLRDLEGQLERVREHYDGPLTVAEDLQSIPLDIAWD
ncbi:MAG: hypothetical protein U5S82_09910 [Gammaproteobacteria bacterium]|nr:hypothetical protein [Gammaproteobacteria bacterium]